jgi:hypothetical protein
MSDLHARLASWFASPVDSQWPHQLAKIIRPFEASLTPTWHPLGFIHVKLAQGEVNDSFRMHVWSSAYRDSREQGEKIHDHLFHIKSRVVFGSIKNVRYQFIPKVGGGHRVVQVDYAPQHSSLRETGIYGNLEEVSGDLFQAPTEYMVSKFELHETFLAASDLALTVVHTTEPEDYKPRAIFKRDARLPPLREPAPCDKGLWYSLLQQMLPI